MTLEEDRCLRRATKLLKRPMSQILQAGVVDAAYNLGFSASGKSPAEPYTGVWPDIPERGEESTKTRTTVNFDPWCLNLLTAAAKHVNVGETMFILGAAFRYLGNLKAAEGRSLAKLELPAKYEPNVDPKPQPS